MHDDAAEIAERFALGRPDHFTGPHARGFQAEVWRLHTALGRWAVKRSFASVAEPDVAEGAAFQEAAHAAGVATPRIVRTVDGSLLADVRFGVVRVDEWVDLEAANPGIDAAAVGTTLAMLHNVDREPLEEFDDWYHQGVGADRWTELLDRLLFAGAPFADGLERQRDELVAMEALFEAPSRMQRCHRDLWADNVRRGGDGRVWVIDWQDCGAADPAQELAALLFEYAYDDGSRARALCNAYVARGGPGRVSRLEQFSMAIAQLGHILEISCQRWLSAASADDRALNEGRVAEFIDKPLSRRVMEQILHAIG
jgi:Ser/Thr protein kinase RdoA (MazF antagonist)